MAKTRSGTEAGPKRDRDDWLKLKAVPRRDRDTATGGTEAVLRRDRDDWLKVEAVPRRCRSGTAMTG